MPREFKELSEKIIPLGRLGTVEEIADCTGMFPPDSRTCWFSVGLCYDSGLEDSD
jgi:hypothetical protein